MNLAISFKIKFINPMIICFVIFTIPIVGAQDKNYEVPPTDSKYGHVPVISDEKMEQCVKIYNEAKWLNEKIQRTPVDQYSQRSVDEYNAMAERHSNMINYFNLNCAGKQSQSAHDAAQKLNRQNYAR